MNPIQLAGFVKRIYPHFDMTTFNDRLKLQKSIYLVQASGINLGYDFKLYLHGPYSTTLARDGFDMPKFNECPTLKLENKELEDKFQKLLKFLVDKKNNADTMEILSSLHLIHELYPEKSNADIIHLVENKSPNFNGKIEQIKKELTDLKNCEVIKW